MDDKIVYKELSYAIVGILFEVYNQLGYGYKEKYYENGIEQYLVTKKINYKRQAPYQIRIQDKIICRQYIDFIVDNKIIIEVKATPSFTPEDFRQCKRYLVSSNIELCLLVNFGTKVCNIKRVLNPKYR